MKHNLKQAFDNQNNLKADIISQLDGLRIDICSASNTAKQLAEIREQNGRLQQKIEGAESALSQSNTERDSLRTTETDLREKMRSLEEELSILQREMQAQSHQYANSTSELQLQLEANSSALEEAIEKEKTREAEIQSLISDLEQTKSNLEDSEIFVATLQEEKTKIEKDAREAEKKIREELARASLRSKDHSRALFEQEQHKLMREKRLAEQDAQKIKEQLETAKRTLVCSSSLRNPSI